MGNMSVGPSCGYENHAVEEVNEGVRGQGNEKERHMEWQGCDNF